MVPHVSSKLWMVFRAARAERPGSGAAHWFNESPFPINK